MAATLFDVLPFENLYWSQMETLPRDQRRILPRRRRGCETASLRLADRFLRYFYGIGMRKNHQVLVLGGARFLAELDFAGLGTRFLFNENVSAVRQMLQNTGCPIQGVLASPEEMAAFTEIFQEWGGRESFSLRYIGLVSGWVEEPTRQAWQTVFGAPVYRQYGACIANECPLQNGLHLHEDYFALQPQTSSDWVLTDRYDASVPPIRFERQIVVETDLCACGRTTVRLRLDDTTAP